MGLHDCPNCECEEENEAGSYRVLRGGSWGYGARLLRSAYRYSFRPSFRYYDVGFRLVRTITLNSFTILPSSNDTQSAVDSLKGVNMSLPNFEFVQIKPGKFMMGSPETEKGRYSDETLHEVEITKGFEIQTTLVTQALWKEIMSNNPSYFKGNSNPVEQVSWNDCQEFIKKMNDRKDGYEYRLPTEEEWEYCARAGTQTAYFFGDDEKDLGDYAWYYKNSDNKTHSVGQKKPNPLGLFDMIGNVWQWIQNEYKPYGK